MFLPFVIIIIASVTVYLAWDTCKNYKERTALLSIYALIVAVCVKYAQSSKPSMDTHDGPLSSGSGGLSEAFAVNMPDVDEAIRESEAEKEAAKDKEASNSNHVDKLVKSTVKKGKRNLERYEDVDPNVDMESEELDTSNFDMAAGTSNKKGSRHIQSVFNPQLVVNVPQAPVVSGNTANLELSAHLGSANLGLANNPSTSSNKTSSLGNSVSPQLAAILANKNDSKFNTAVDPADRRDKYMLDMERIQQSHGRQQMVDDPDQSEGFSSQYMSPSPGFSRTCGGSRASIAPVLTANTPLVAREGFTSRRRPVTANKKHGKEGFTISGRAKAAVDRREFCQSRSDEQGLRGSRETDYLARCIARQQGERDYIETEEEHEKETHGASWNSSGKEYNSTYRTAMGSRQESPNKLRGRTAGVTPPDEDEPDDAGVSWSKNVERRWHKADKPGRPRFANWMAAYQDHAPGDPAPFPAGKLDPKTLTNRTYIPGMTYMPPSEWSVPQYHPTYCRQTCPGCPPHEFKLRGMAGRRTERDPEVGLFPLEMAQDGTIAKTEDEVTVGNVGYMMPKFEYREYVDCQRPSRKGGRHQPGMGWGDMPDAEN